MQKRPTVAIFFLLLMLVNFASEGVALFYVHSAILFPDKGTVCESATDGCSQNATASATSSCCAAKKKPSACGCPCCGESCPMGDACTCTQDGKRSQSDGLFFRLPGCHPLQDTDDGSYLPLSMRLVYLCTDATEVINPVFVLAVIKDRNAPIAGPDSVPPVPPPRFAAA